MLEKPMRNPVLELFICQSFFTFDLLTLATTLATTTFAFACQQQVGDLNKMLTVLLKMYSNGASLNYRLKKWNWYRISSSRGLKIESVYCFMKSENSWQGAVCSVWLQVLPYLIKVIARQSDLHQISFSLPPGVVWNPWKHTKQLTTETYRNPDIHNHP